MSTFKKDKPCVSVKIWSRSGALTELMFGFGSKVYHEFNKGLIEGEVCASGCIYRNEFITAFAKKTSGGMASICVEMR